MKVFTRSTLIWALTIPAMSVAALAQQGAPTAGYKLLRTITIPTGLAGNDISWVDSATARYYLADRGNAAATPAVGPSIDVIDTETDQFVTSIPLPSPGNGDLSIPRAHEIWVGMNNSTVAVISTDTNQISHTVNTGGTGRADEIAWDPDDRLILIANDRDTPPFVSFISQETYQVVKRVTYDGSAGPTSTGGIEQPLWDGAAGKFYIAIPSTKTNANGEIDELDPVQFTVSRVMPSACKGPSGLVLIPNQRLASACGDIIDIASGKVITTVSGVSGDEIWYNSGDQRIYYSGSQTVGVVDANTGQKLTALPVGVPAAAPAPAQSTHSLAADSVNNKILIAVSASGTGKGSGVGIQVWRNGASITITPNPIPTVAGAFFGSAIVHWTAPNVDAIEIHIGSPTGPLFAEGSNRGSAPTGIWVAEGTTFYLQDVSGGKQLTAADTLATAVAHLQSM